MPLRAFIITQEDCLYLPQFLHTVLRHRRANLVGISILPTLMPKQTWTTTLRDHLALYGPTQFFRQGVRYATRRALGIASRYLPLPGHYSVEGVAREYDLPIHEAQNVNSKEYLDLLRSLEIDLIILGDDGFTRPTLCRWHHYPVDQWADHTKDNNRHHKDC